MRFAGHQVTQLQTTAKKQKPSKQPQEENNMINQFIRQFTHLFTNRSANSLQTKTINDASQNSHSRAKTNGSSSNGFHPHNRPNGFGDMRYRDQNTGYRHNAERLLRDGHLRIAITGFNDTAINVSIMNRHDSPQLESAVSDLPCKVKMVDRRNITAGLLAAINTLDDGLPGRRGIVLITSGDTAAGQDQLQQLAKRAAEQKIGIHVICLGAKVDDITGGPRINTHSTLGYGKFWMAENADSLLAAIRDAFQGLTPAFGMHGTNEAVILLDCSETMVESYRNTTRIDLVITALQEFLKAPLVRNGFPVADNRRAQYPHLNSRRKPVSWQSSAVLEAAGSYDWSPGSH
jgi:hypothetical protein